MHSKKKMFNSLQDILRFILGLELIIFTVYIFLKTGQLVIKNIKYVSDNYPTIMVALITGSLTFIGVPVGKYFENRYNIKNQIRNERQKIYIEFLDWLIKNVLYAEIKGNKDYN